MEILKDGLLELCKNDPEIENLVRPRFNEIISMLDSFIALIQKFNPSHSLVASDDAYSLCLRHILDSLSPLGIILRNLKKYQNETRLANISIADIGSGAGLPGIPLAFVLPEAKFTLIERKTRRVNFLRNVKEALALNNVEIEEAEMEKLKPRPYSALVFRAFRPLEPKLLKKLFRLCDNKGFLAAYKGRKVKTEAEIKLLEKTIPDFSSKWELFPCPVPGLDEERHLLVIFPSPV